MLLPLAVASAISGCVLSSRCPSSWKLSAPAAGPSAETESLPNPHWSPSLPEGKCYPKRETIAAKARPKMAQQPALRLLLLLLLRARLRSAGATKPTQSGLAATGSHRTTQLPLMPGCAGPAGPTTFQGCVPWPQDQTLGSRVAVAFAEPRHRGVPTPSFLPAIVGLLAPIVQRAPSSFPEKLAQIADSVVAAQEDVPSFLLRRTARP